MGWEWGSVCVCVRLRASAGSSADLVRNVFGKGTCSLSETRGRVQRNGGNVFAFVSMALTEKQTLRGRGALEAFNLRLREDFHELEQA